MAERRGTRETGGGDPTVQALRRVAHDLNNPLTAVTMAAAALRSAVDDGERDRLIGLVEREAMRAGQIVASAIASAGDDAGAQASVDGGDLPDDAIPGDPVPAATAGPATASDHVPRRGRALVVDDDAAVRSLLLLALGHDGWQVTAVGSGREAVAAVEDSPPDLVLLDLHLAAESGPDVAALLVERDAGIGDRIVYLTGDEAAELDVAGRPALRKPFALAELRALADRVAPPAP